MQSERSLARSCLQRLGVPPAGVVPSCARIGPSRSRSGNPRSRNVADAKEVGKYDPGISGEVWGLVYFSRSGLVPNLGSRFVDYYIWARLPVVCNLSIIPQKTQKWQTWRLCLLFRSLKMLIPQLRLWNRYLCQEQRSCGMLETSTSRTRVMDRCKYPACSCMASAEDAQIGSSTII